MGTPTLSPTAHRLQLTAVALAAALFGAGVLVATLHAGGLDHRDAVLYGTLSAFGGLIASGQLVERALTGWPVEIVGFRPSRRTGAQSAAYGFGGLVWYTALWLGYLYGGILAIWSLSPLPQPVAPLYAGICALGCIICTVRMATAASCTANAGEDQ